jgi:hypothetical protein
MDVFAIKTIPLVTFDVRSTNNYEQLESQASNDNGESNRNFNGRNQSDRNFNNRGRGNYRGQNESFIQNNRRGWR